MNMQDENDWDLTIRPQAGLFDLNLKDVWKYKDLLFMFVKRDFISFYKQTILGPVWFFIQPLFTMGVYIFIFGNLAGLSTDGIPRPLFYLSGITAWTYFSDCLTKTSTVFSDNAGIFGKVYFPRLIMPLSIVVSNLIRLGIQSFLLACFFFYYMTTGWRPDVTLYILWLPLLIIIMAILGLGLGMIISSLTTKYRDLALLVRFSVQLLMYTTSVVYPLSSLTGKAYWIVAANPLTFIIEGIRKGLFGEGIFDWNGFFYCSGTTLLILFIGVVIFNKVEKNFVDTI
jgi:lipopolysaccharide transport system permease protein